MKKRVRFLKEITGVKIGETRLLGFIAANALIDNGTCELVDVVKVKPIKHFDKVDDVKIEVTELIQKNLTKEVALKMKLEDLRKLYPEIKSNSVKKFVSQINF
jgi:hypothetical protein